MGSVRGRQGKGEEGKRGGRQQGMKEERNVDVEGAWKRGAERREGWKRVERQEAREEWKSQGSGRVEGRREGQGRDGEEEEEAEREEARRERKERGL